MNHPLTTEQVDSRLAMIDRYIHASNAASGSVVDANANVSQKNIATLEAEMMKDYFIQVNRAKMTSKIAELFGEPMAKEYLRQIEAHEIYVHDETSLKPYCASITMYPLLLDGLTKLGGESTAPKHIESFCGSFVNLVFAISAQFAGAIATVEFLMYFDYFCRKDYGENYLETHRNAVANHLQHVVYAINQPAAARGYQSVFWNISLYDEHYFNSMFGSFVFPDMSSPTWESLDKLQHFFLDWFNAERSKSILTFPVVTAAMLTENGAVKSVPFKKMCSKNLAEGGSFFMYQSDSADSLASCCRLRNEVSDHSFSYSLGAGGVSTGSINVITINMNRLVQDKRDLATEVAKIHAYQVAYRKITEEYIAQGMLPVYDAGFIHVNKQYLTIGINGMVEAAESQGIKPGVSPEYMGFVDRHLKVIYDANRAASEKWGYKFNTEFVPAENLGVKNAQWDRKDKYHVSRDCYNSYFYPVEDVELNHMDKLLLHGSKMTKFLDGGSALHLNLEEALSAAGYEKLLDAAAKVGCNYFCTNVKVTICNECGFIDKRTLGRCSCCGAQNVDYGTRIIGYLKRVSSFSEARQSEHERRFYSNK